MRNLMFAFRITKNGTKAVFFIVALCVLSGCSKRASQPIQPLPQVGFITTNTTEIVYTIQLPGRSSAFMLAKIRPQVSGIILQKLFREGGSVQAGQQLYQIDPSIYKAQYDSDIATLNRFKAALIADQSLVDRYKPLSFAQAVSKQDYQNALAKATEDRANIDFVKAQIQAVEISLNYTKVLSPISGIISASSVTKGALVTANQPAPLATVTQLDPIYVDIYEPTSLWLQMEIEANSRKLRSSQDETEKVYLELGNGVAYKYAGKLQLTQVNVNQTTDTILIRAIFPNPQHLLLPGMYVQTKIEEGIDKNAILVPQQSVTRDQTGNALVFLINKENKIVEKTITVEKTYGSDWIVDNGLTPGDRVVVDSFENIAPGVKVNPINETDQFDLK